MLRSGQVQGNMVISANSDVASLTSLISNDIFAELTVSGGDVAVYFTTNNNNAVDYVLNITNSGSGTAGIFGVVSSRPDVDPDNPWGLPAHATRTLTITNSAASTGDVQIKTLTGNVTGDPVQVEIVGDITAANGSVFYDSANTLVTEGNSITEGVYAWDTAAGGNGTAGWLEQTP